jgi:WD40 repeat protein
MSNAKKTFVVEPEPFGVLETPDDGQLQKKERWDDPPPEKDKPEIAENDTSLLLVRRHQVPNHLRRQVSRLEFSKSDGILVAMLQGVADGKQKLALYSTQKYQNLGLNSLYVAQDFALGPILSNMVACAFPVWERMQDSGDVAFPIARVEVHDMVNKRRTAKIKFPIKAPMAFSPNGALIACASEQNPSQIWIVHNKEPNSVARVIPSHLDHVTHLAFLPDGSALISLSKDGVGRMTCMRTGTTLRKFELETRYAAQILQISPDGELVATVWGREVMLWYPRTGGMSGYNLNMTRTVEAWPLCISSDCRYLACRSEGGVDISDLATGKFRGEVVTEQYFATAAAFNSDSNVLAVAMSSGHMEIFDVIIAC